MNDVQLATSLDAIAALADDIARASPECARKADRIRKLAEEAGERLDRGAIQTRLEAELAGDLSEARLQRAVSLLSSRPRADEA